jgi:hypothetical protein
MTTENDPSTPGDAPAPTAPTVPSTTPAASVDGSPRATSPSSSQAALGSAVRVVAVTSVVLVAIAALAFDTRTAVGVALGGLLATANLALFVRLGRAFLEQRENGAAWGLIGAIKLLGLFVAVWLLLRRGDVPALALVLGYAALPLGITLSTLVRPKP